MPGEINMDFIANGKAHGGVASLLLNNKMDVGLLRPYVAEDGRSYVTVNGVARPTANATLRKDEWKHLDEAVLMAVQDRLIGVADLESRGLVYNIPNGMGTTVLEYEDMSDLNDAEISMDGVSRGKGDRPEFDLNYLPLPITHADFSFSARVIEASRMRGASLDVSTAQLKARKVAEKIESMLFTGASAYTFGGGTIRGLMDHANRNTVTLTAHWNDSAATGETILDDVLSMKQALINDGYYGPYMLYVPTNFETSLDEDFKSDSDKSVRQRLLEVSGIQGVKVADKLTNDNVILVQMTSDVVRMINGMRVTTVQWESQGGMSLNFKVMAIQVPQIRADQDGNSGVCHGSK